jgi:hypothetical protein
LYVPAAPPGTPLPLLERLLHEQFRCPLHHPPPCTAVPPCRQSRISAVYSPTYPQALLAKPLLHRICSRSAPSSFDRKTAASALSSEAPASKLQIVAVTYSCGDHLQQGGLNSRRCSSFASPANPSPRRRGERLGGLGFERSGVSLKRNCLARVGRRLMIADALALR